MRLIAARSTGHRGAQRSMRFDVDLIYVNAPNGKGKTWLLEVLLMSLAGRHPTAGTGGAPTSSGETIMRQAVGEKVQATTEWRDNEGRRIEVSQTWKRSRKTVKGIATISYPKPVLTVTTADGRGLEQAAAKGYVAATFGDSALYDGETLIGAKASSTARRKLLFSYVVGSPWTVEDLWTHAEAMGVDEEAVIGVFDRPELDTAKFYRPWESGPLVSWMRSTHEELAKIANADAVSVRNSSKALDALEGDPIDGHEVATLKATLDAVKATNRLKLSGLSEAVETELVSAIAEVAKADKREKLEDRRARATAELDAASGETAGAERERVSAALAKVPTEETSASAVQTAREALDAADAKMEADHTAWQTAFRAASDAHEKLSVVRAERGATREAASPLDIAEALLEKLRGVIDDADEAFEAPKCPLCRSTFEPEGSLAEAESDLAALRETLKVEAAAKQLQANARQALLSAFQSADDKTDRLLAAFRASQDARERKRTVLTETTTVASDHTDNRKRLEQEIASLAGATANPARVAALVETAARVERELDELGAVDGALFRGETTQAARSTLAAAQTECDSAEDTATRSLRTADRRLQRKQDAETQRATVLESVARATLSSKAADVFGPTGLQEQILTAGLASFTEAVNECLPEDRRPFRVRFADSRGTSACIFESAMAGAMLPVEALCHGEWVPIEAAIMAGARRHARCPWDGIIIDGVEGVSYENRQALFANLGALQRSGRVGQVIALGCSDSPDAPEGWTVRGVEG